MMNIKFHGAAREVGRSSIKIESKEGKFLLDCGIKLTPMGVVYPYELDDLVDVDKVFISHAHLDHTGALPFLNYYGNKSKIYSTIVTKKLAEILLKDSYKISKIESHKLPYSSKNIKSVLDRFEDKVEYGKTFNFKDLEVKAYDAGHIPGSCSYLFNFKKEKKKVFYTGDFNLEKTKLLTGAKYNDLKNEDVDVLITESTYGDKSHPDRDATLKRFKEIIKERTQVGPVLVPVFAVGRSQEMIMTISQMNLDVPIYFDGMAKRVTKLFMKHSEFVGDVDALKKAASSVTFLNRSQDLSKLAKKRCVFITTSGMISGGPSLSFFKDIFKNPDATVLLTGYQAEETHGRALLDEGIFERE
ncbi:MAG: MBL fold metallo-hydrolase, partial [Candidatus Woesearchaeota archaeon]